MNALYPRRTLSAEPASHNVLRFADQVDEVLGREVAHGANAAPEAAEVPEDRRRFGGRERIQRKTLAAHMEEARVALMQNVINLTDAKNRLSELVERARGGERIRILVRGAPVAELVPITGRRDGPDEERLASLERRGIIRRGTGKIPDCIWEPGPKVSGNSVSDALIEERREGDR